ncbi:MAG: HEAT repeat domain-containing protein, partial [Verrucomicrobiota bacterium]
ERFDGFVEQVRPLLQADNGAVRAAAAWALARIDDETIAEILDTLDDDSNEAVQRMLGKILAEYKPEGARDTIFRLLEKARPSAREEVCASAYQVLGSDRAALASAMRYDPSLMVNLGMFRLLDRLEDDALDREVLYWCAEQHPNEYIRSRALRAIEEREDARIRELCLDALKSPFWIVRLEAADILSRTAEPEDVETIRAASEGIENEWLSLAFEDALHRAQGKPAPERVRLNLGETEHTEGGHTPGGFQTWIDSPPDDPKKARAMVDDGYRFGVKNYPPNVPGGSTLNNMNNNVGMRNIHLLESILDPLESKWKDQLPYLYYIALFDEPFGLGSFFHPGRVKAMLLEAGRADLLDETQGLNGKELGNALPANLRRAYEWYNAKFGGIASNWAVHMFRLTAQRKYPGLQIFPQSLSYMRKKTADAFDMIDADGDYSWIYHQGNFFRDGTIGAVNRVINPGKPLCMITWMGWHKPNIINGNTLYMDTNYPDGPWRFRNYMGTRSGLALWATGTEAGFFDHIGFGKSSNKDAKGQSARAFKLKPWSEPAKKAVRFMMDDSRYWKDVEGKIAMEDLDERGGAGSADVSMEENDGMDEDNLTLEGGPTPEEEALQEKKDEMFEKLMTGISYMNIFNTDTTRALSNLPKPDTRKRDSLIISGRDSAWYADGAYFRIPATAVLQGFDMVPNYDCIGQAELMHYDTILLQSSRDGVNLELIKKINHWLRTKKDGLLIVAGKIDGDNLLFPSLTLDSTDEAFLWEDSVSIQHKQRMQETTKNRKGREHTRTVPPRLGTFHAGGGDGDATHSNARVDCTISGDVTPLLTTAEGEAVFARWNAPETVKSVVLFDGADAAGPAYTEAIEEQILAIDEERGASIKRNPWWGHTIYENDEFVVDVATSQLGALHDARPRKHEGVDVITGVINPEVRHRECAMILKDYVGPYAGGRDNWAVLAREKLVSMDVDSPDRLRVEAEGVTRVTRIGAESIQLTDAAGFEKVDDQVQVWKQMREGKKAYSINQIDGGYELHVYSPAPFIVVAEK